MPLLFFCFKTLLLFPKNNCYFCTLCFVFLAIVIWIFSTVACIGLTTKGFLFTFMVGPWNSFYIIWKGGRMLWDLIYQELPAKGKAFFQCWVSPTILASVTKLTLKINMKCQDNFCKHFFEVFEKFPSWSFNALSSIYINSPFLNLDKTMVPLLKESAVPNATPTKKTKRYCQYLEEPDEISESTAIKFQHLPSQARRKKAIAAIFHEYLIDVYWKPINYLKRK